MYEYETITGRKEKTIDYTYGNNLKGTTILITGIGTIGSGVAKLLSRFCERLVLVDIREEPLASISDDLTYLGFKNFETILLDLKEDSVIERLKDYSFDYIINTAAYKHVLICENNPDIAFKNNIKIAENILKLNAKYYNILISSDKAVYPNNVMGMTKRTNELLYMMKDKTKIIRFGNVYGSSGSLVPRIINGIDKGKVFVTDEKTERFFMTIDEACGLILEAMFSNKFTNILDMGEPLNIRKIIEKMIEVSGKKVDIIQIGLFPEEKLSEKLRYDSFNDLSVVREVLNRYNTPLDIYFNLDKFDFDVE